MPRGCWTRPHGKSTGTCAYIAHDAQEWFAEAYSAFYTPVQDGQEKGALVKEKLPETHKWFVAHVDNQQAFAKKAKAAHKKDKAPRKP